MHKKKKLFALVFFGLIVALLIVEGLLRFLGWGFVYLQDRQNREALSSTNIVLDQTQDLQQYRAEEKELILLCIGESTTAGGWENSWPRQLQRILNSLQDEKTFRVINGGGIGTHTDAILEHLPGYLNTYKPDFVLAMAGINDVFHEPYPEKTSSGQFSMDILAETNFRAYGLIKWIAGGIKVRVTGKTEGVTTVNVVGEGGNGGKSRVYGLVHSNVTHLQPHTIRNLNDMVNLTTDRGINFVFVQYALRKTDILKNVIENKNVFYISNYERFVDLLEQYDYDDLFTDTFAEDFGHATTFGNRNIADNVARQLLKHLKLQEQSN